MALNRFSASNIQARLTVGDWTLPLAQGEQIVISSRRPGEDHVMLMDAPLVFVGYGVKAPERDWDDFKGQDVKGKILVVLINDPDFDGPIADGGPDFNGKAMTYYGRWTYKYEEAAKRGAAGVMIVHEDAPASYGWNTVKNSNTNTMFDVVRANPAASHTGFESWVTASTARKLFADAGLDFDAAKAAAARATRAASAAFAPGSVANLESWGMSLSLPPICTMKRP